MNPPVSAPHRRAWLWIVGILVAPFLLLGLAAANYLTLDRDAWALRRHVIHASDCDWNTKMQFSVGRFSLACMRTGLGFIPDSKEYIHQARQALGAIRNASVGVYELHRTSEWSAGRVFEKADEKMRIRGFARVVTVSGQRETVMIYVDENVDEGNPIDICVGIVDGRQLVIVSATINAEAIAEFIDTHAGDRIRERLRTTTHF